MVGVMGGEQHAMAGLGQPAHARQQAQLAAVVQAIAGFVKHQQPRALRQRAGNQHPLALAARQLGVAPLGQRGQFQLGQRGVGGLVVGAAGGGQQAMAGQAPQQHHLAHPIRKRRLMQLRHIGQLARQRPSRPGG